MDFDKGRVVQESPVPSQSFLETFSYEIHHSKCIFTDGSKTPSAEFSGFAIVTDDRTMHRTAGFLSTFSIEAMAILEGLILCQELDYSSFSIFTDSLSVLSVLKSPFNFTKSSHLVLYIRKTIMRLENEGKWVKFFWVSSHVGILGNERADSLAKMAVRKGKDSYFRSTLREFKNLNKDRTYDSLCSTGEMMGFVKGVNYF